MWVLGDEFAGEGVFQYGLTEGLGGLQLGVDVGFELLDEGERILGSLDNDSLFIKRRQWNYTGNDMGIVNLWDVRAITQFCEI